MKCINPTCNGQCYRTFCEDCIKNVPMVTRIKLLYQHDLNAEIRACDNNAIILPIRQEELPFKIKEKKQTLKQVKSERYTDKIDLSKQKSRIKKLQTEITTLQKELERIPMKILDIPKQRQVCMDKLKEKNMQLLV